MNLHDIKFILWIFSVTPQKNDVYFFCFRNTMIITMIAATAATQSISIGDVSPVFTLVVPLVVVDVVLADELGGVEGDLVDAGVTVGFFTVGVGVCVAVGVGVCVAVGVGMRSISPSFGYTVGE